MNKLKNKTKLDYIDELKQIRDFVESNGYELTLEETHKLWEDFSWECYNAGFLNVNTEVIKVFWEWLNE